MTLNDLQNNLKQAFAMKERSTKPRYSDNHVFDENKTVLWNKEEANRLNKEYTDDTNFIKQRKQDSIQMVEDDIIAYIQKETGFKRAICKKIYQLAKEEAWCDSYQNAEDIIEELSDILNVFEGEYFGNNNEEERN